MFNETSDGLNGLSGDKSKAKKANKGQITTMPLPQLPVVSDKATQATSGGVLDNLKSIPTMYWLIGGVALFFLMGKR